MGAAVVGAVLDADERRLGTAEVSPLAGLHDRVTLADDAPEEVVRRQEHQVPTAVPVLLDDVVLALRHVLVMAREHDEVVCLRERAPLGTVLDIALGQVVDVAAGAGEPAEEGQVVPAEVVRDAAVEVGTAEGDLRLLPGGVPGVAFAVLVVVPEVVALPGDRRQDDGDAVLAQPARREHERGEADATVGGGEAAK